MSAARGTLWLVPTPLDFKQTPQPPLAQVLPGATIAQAAQLTHWIGENAKSTRAFLQRVAAVQPLALPLQALTISDLPRAAHKHGDHQANAAIDQAARALLAPAMQGTAMGLVSEAGLPAVADPGASVVRAAHALGLSVQPLPGRRRSRWRWPPAAWVGNTLPLLATCPRARPARRRCGLWSKPRSVWDKLKFVLKRPTATPRYWPTCCNTCSPTRGWRWRPTWANSRRCVWPAWRNGARTTGPRPARRVCLCGAHSPHHTRR